MMIIILITVCVGWCSRLCLHDKDIWRGEVRPSRLPLLCLSQDFLSRARLPLLSDSFLCGYEAVLPLTTYDASELTTHAVFPFESTCSVFLL